MFDIPFVFPQSITMNESHRSILRRNKELLVRDLDVNMNLCAHLVQSGVFTVSMEDEILVC